MTEVQIPVQVHNGHPGMSIRRSSGPKSVCQCCPYGYHIDLDFVRFCEMLSKNNSEPSPSKRQRRERRRQRQSMEILLGLAGPVLLGLEQQFLPTIEQESSPTSSEPPPPPARTSSLTHGSDALKKAVQDFEATLERTAKRGQAASRPSASQIFDAFAASADRFCRPDDGPAHASNDFSSVLELEMINACNAGPLENIREQMAISLERMRELEEKVKVIPNLEVEVRSLKSEKSELIVKMNQLKSKLSQKEEELKQGRKPRSRSNSRERSSKVRDVGVTCAVLTRDIGIAPVVRKWKNASTETNRQPKVYATGSQTQQENQNKSTATDLLMSEIQSEAEKKSKRLSLKDMDVVVAEAPFKLSKGVQATFREPATVLQVVERREAAVQVEEIARPCREIGVVAKPKTTDVVVDVRTITREIGVSDDKTTDLICDKCRTVKTKSIGVGYGNVKVAEVVPSNLVAPPRSKSFDLSKTKLTRNVAVGTVAPVKKMTSSKNVDTQDLVRTRSKHAASNTNKMKLVDAAVGVDAALDLNTIAVCDSCKKETRPASKTPTLHHTETPQPSKIPRPKSNSSTPVMERKKFVRQDTYTKPLPTQQTLQKDLLELSKRPKHRLKSPIDKLESHPEEKVEVILRKKNKTGEQSSSEAEKHLSKDLKECRLSESSERYSSQFEDFCFDYDEHYEEGDSKRNSQMFPENALFLPIQDKPREKIKPSKEMKAAMKVVNDSLIKFPSGLPRHLKNASNIIQQEWFKISSTASANPLDVEDYLDSFEEVSSTLLEYIVNMVDNNGNTAMHYAVSHGNFDVVSILLDSKVCNINKANAAGFTCIMLVSLAQVRSETHRQVVRRLFQLADVNVRAKQHGQTALMLAVSHGRLDMVKLLLEAGADPNIQDGDGSTALMCAAEHGHTDIVRHILAHPDCDSSIVDSDGSTALAIAMEAGNKDIGVLLYAREHFASSSRGSSPYTSLKHRRSKATASPLSRTPTSPNPNRRSDHSI